MNNLQDSTLLEEIENPHSRKIKLWINACEVSGDLQAGILLNSLKKNYPNLQAIGMGGNKLEEEGMVNFFHINELSVMGITEILQSIPKIFSLLRQIKQSIKEQKPDAILLVDSAEFNFKIAKFAKKLNIPVYYFIPPKVWAWREYRLNFLKKYIKSILCILPFEVDYYKENNIDVTYIQNPLMNFLAPYKKSEAQIKPLRIALMPGSRKKEVTKLLPVFAHTCAILKNEFPQAEFYIIQAPNFTEDYLKEVWHEADEIARTKEVDADQHDVSNFPIPAIQCIKSSKRYEFLRTCEFCIAASGTATLETGLLGLPTVISYKVSPFSYFIGKNFVKVKYIGLVNLIMNKEVFPEYIQEEAHAENLSRQIKEWIYKPDKIEIIRKELQALDKKMQAEDKDLTIF